MLQIGKISKPFGTDGGVIVNLYDTFPRELNSSEPLLVIIDKLAVPLFIEHFERRGRSGAIMRFADIDTPIRAGLILGRELYMRRHEEAIVAADDDQLYFEDLIGYLVTITESDTDKEPLRGVITDFIDSDMNPLLQIEAEGGEILIPAADEFIVSVDEERREIALSVPEGLTELQ
jgi:16S rRNA processing protein RimM